MFKVIIVRKDDNELFELRFEKFESVLFCLSACYKHALKCGWSCDYIVEVLKNG